MDDSSLALISLIVGGGIVVASLFIGINLFPLQSSAILGAGILFGTIAGLGYFIMSKKYETGYFRLPKDLAELHEEVTMMESASCYIKQLEDKEEKEGLLSRILRMVLK